MPKTPRARQQTAVQIAKVLMEQFPLKGPSDSNILMVLEKLEKDYPAANFFVEEQVVDAIQQLHDRLADDPKVQRNLNNFCTEHHEIAWSAASRSLLLRLAIENRDTSTAGLEYSLAENANSFPRSAVAKEQAAAKAQAERDAEEIIELRKTLILAHGKTKVNYRGQDYVWKEAVKKETARLLSMDLQQLRAEVERRSLRTKLAAMDKDTRRETVRAMTKAAEPPAPTYEFPKLPRVIYPRGVTPVTLDKHTLNFIANHDVEYWKMLKNKYGAEQLAARLREQE